MDKVSSGIRRSVFWPKGKARAPYDAPVSVLQRMAYEFVRDHRLSTADILITTAIENYRDKQEDKKPTEDRRNLRRLRIAYKINPFHWVLSGLECGINVPNFNFGKHDVFRLSQQLIYADRHDMPPHLLVGFLYQSGTIKDVCNKAKDPSRREQWHSAIPREGD